ncbi:MAG: ABC transporter ATP-binding protein [Spirochaetes bacterium]|nr:MAG: ABC transporter ATP-binding protein [Spirochaetota bacterium]
MNEPEHIVVSARNLSKRYTSGWIFRGIDLRGTRGESIAITGPNGSGKSTLCEILAGLRHPTGGTVCMSAGGRELTAAQRRLAVGFTSPRLALYGDLSAFETVEFICGSRGVPSMRAQSLCARMGLDAHIHKRVRVYSSGMRQRLKIALALAHTPSVLLLDEPGTNLDAPGRLVLAELIEEARPSTLIIIATNEESEARLCAGTVRLA